VIIELENKLKAWNLTGWGAKDVVVGTDVQDRFAVWSPDSTRIAWWTRRLGNYDIYVTDVIDDPKKQAEIQKNLTADSDATDRNPRFSPDGTKILFESKRDGNWEIYVMDSDTGKNLVSASNHAKTDRNGSWSRNGKKIIFESVRDGNFEIYVVDADGNNPVNLTNHKKSDTFSRWSPNGRRIAFVSTRDGNKEIYAMDANGANPVNLSNDPGDDNFPQWRGLGPGAFPSKELAVESLTKQLTTLGHIKQTALLQNYPNPFNPETWMPYILSEDSSVTICTYTASGQLVRTLALGHQKQDAYLFRTQAAYWEGNNDEGEAVSSGVYFYELRASDFSAIRKMVIEK
jgi:WD40 repeat protein